MKILFGCCLILIASVFLGCGNVTSAKNNCINSISVNQSEGVGPVVFIFELIVNDNELKTILTNNEFNLTFPERLSQLSGDAIRVFNIDSSKVHLNITTTLWAELSPERFSLNQKSLNKELELKISSDNGLVWSLENKCR